MAYFQRRIDRQVAQGKAEGHDYVAMRNQHFDCNDFSEKSHQNATNLITIIERRYFDVMDESDRMVDIISRQRKEIEHLRTILLEFMINKTLPPSSQIYYLGPYDCLFSRAAKLTTRACKAVIKIQALWRGYSNRRLK